MKINRISSPPNGSYFKEILFLVGKDKRKVPLLVCCFLLVGILDVLGISLTVPYVALIVDPELLKSSRVSFLVDILGVGRDSRELIFLLSTALALIFSLKACSAILPRNRPMLVLLLHSLKMDYARSFFNVF